ncbi:MAG TPA: class I SAM-dependent methyltransferase [Thermoleophilaceae bacterium]|jgi:SAM-dependent methyltransferase
MSQHAIDERNASFWDTLCGSNLAQRAGITGRDPDDLRRFDEVYLGFYPYLERYVPADFGGGKVLEVGLGYGTLGQLIASRKADYYGADIAEGPVEMMRVRLSWLGVPEDHAVQASVLELPFEEASFDHVYSIGCLHHTGDLERSVQEVHRVLRPGGRAVVMLYNRHSLRRLRFAAARAVRGRRAGTLDDELRGVYDAHDGGEAAPHTDFVSRADVRRLFRDFARVKIDVQNFDGYRFGLRREWFLNNLARVVGLDLYIMADKAR